LSAVALGEGGSPHNPSGSLVIQPGKLLGTLGETNIGLFLKRTKLRLFHPIFFAKNFLNCYHINTPDQINWGYFYEKLH